MPTDTIPDHTCHVIARDDDYFFGLLQSRIHELWTLAVCNWMGVGNDPRYNSSKTFETFPFPWPPGHEPSKTFEVSETSKVLQEQAIAQAARELVDKRDLWLAEAASEQDIDPAYLTGLNAPRKKPKKSEARTLTNLYNQRPTWLDLAHKKLDAAVAAAYSWPTDLGDDEILGRLLALNLERAAREPE